MSPTSIRCIFYYSSPTVREPARGNEYNYYYSRSRNNIFIFSLLSLIYLFCTLARSDPSVGRGRQCRRHPRLAAPLGRCARKSRDNNGRGEQRISAETIKTERKKVRNDCAWRLKTVVYRNYNIENPHGCLSNTRKMAETERKPRSITSVSLGLSRDVFRRSS